MHEGRPNCLDLIVNGDVQLLINTPLGKHAQRDDYTLRQAAIANRVAYTTTMSAASAACDAILSLRSRAPSVRSLQEWQRESRRKPGGRDERRPFVHESAYVDDGAVIGDGHEGLAFLSRPAAARSSASAARLGQNVVVMNGVRIGNNVQDPEQRVDLRGRRARGRRVLRPVDGVHERR